jgi:hypothetical protein
MSLVKIKCLNGFQALNILNEKYQSVASRPMPGRNYSINLILNYNNFKKLYSWLVKPIFFASCNKDDDKIRSSAWCL